MWPFLRKCLPASASCDAGSPGAFRREYAAIRTALRRLESCPKATGIFGANGHGFVVNQPLDEEAVVRFESEHRICLPADYRGFLIHVGNGGAGPAYGVFKLGEMDNAWRTKHWKENDGFVGALSEPFPHTQAWNDLSGKPAFDESRELDQEYEDAYWAEVDAWYERHYWNPHWVNGAFPICHEGCAYRDWLVVSGPEAGTIWGDGRPDEKGLCPVLTRGGQHASFLAWYCEWLDSALGEAGL